MIQQTNSLEFIDDFDSLMIASVDDKCKPHCSYAPFVSDENNYYICISQIAKHTKNLLNSKETSIMFIEDESETKNSFARKRVTYDVAVKQIDRNSTQFDHIMNLFIDKFGEKASIYKQMNDFHLFKLEPISGNAVLDFGKKLQLSKRAV